MPNSAASFGWEVTDLNNNGANIFFKVNRNMALKSIDIDTSLTITALTGSGFLEVLCQGSISRQAEPALNQSGQEAYVTSVPSADFGAATLMNPNNLNVVFNENLAQDLFYSVILKAFAPDDGSGASAFRHVHAEISLTMNVGDYVVFHMDHFGVPCDAEMQVVLAYSTE